MMMTAVPSWLLYVPAAVLAGGLVLFAVAVRGRRIDDHPICRRCGFDLSGKPPESTRCNECGADLARRRAVRLGNRRRRHRLAYAAAAGVVVGGGWLGIGGWQAARSVDWNRHKPIWWVKKDLEAAPGPARDAALRELGRRVGAGALPDVETAALVDRALAYQADVARPWSPAWGELVEAARSAGKCPAATWKRYLAQSVTFNVEVLGRENRAGEPIVVRLLRGPDRVGAHRFDLELEADPKQVKIDGYASDYDPAASGGALGYEETRLTVPAGPAAPAGPTRPASAVAAPGPAAAAAGGLLARGVFRTGRLSAGAHAITWPVTLRAAAQADGLVATLAIALFADDKFGARSADAAGTFALLDPAAPAADGGPPGADLRRWLAGVTVDAVRLRDHGGGAGGLTVDLTVPAAPRAVRIAVRLRPVDGPNEPGNADGRGDANDAGVATDLPDASRAAGREVDVGTLFIEPGAAGQQELEAAVFKLTATTADVVLRLATDEPDTAEARRKSAEREVVVRGVEVHRHP